MALSPMMQHYLATKKEYPDCILFYRLGDFYEMFFDDARTVSGELELTLTGKSCGLPERAPMCGVPFHAADTYIAKLIERGYKVAVCEQTEDPKKAKGMVKREVIRVVTPGTLLNSSELDESKNNYIMSIAAFSDLFGIALADISTGRCLLSEVADAGKLNDEILRFQPAEIICNQTFFVSGIDTEELKSRLHLMFTALDDRYFHRDNAVGILKKHFHVNSLDGLGVSEFPGGTIAAGALLQYLYETQKSDMQQLTAIHPYRADRYMLLSNSTRRNLELTETLREKEKRGSLLWVLDNTKTAMGARMLRTFIVQPLLDRQKIEARLDTVETLVTNPMIRDELREYLQPVYDLERLVSRIISEAANPRDLAAFRESVKLLPSIRQLLSNLPDQGLIGQIRDDLDPLEDLCRLLSDTLVEDPPLAMKDGGIIRDGCNEKVDQYRNAKQDGKRWLAELEERERESTGIRTLRIRFNKVFGYCIEVTNSFKNQVPDRYIRRQTLTGAERYTTQELKEMEDTILGAEDKLTALEYDLFCDLRNRIGAEVKRIQKTASAVAQLDVFASMAYAAERNRYVRPEILESDEIDIRGGRHPVVEKMIPDQMFVPNDTVLNQSDARVAIITGPNMAGKSTYMRQTALIVLMAQIGCYVPADSARIGLVDRIFTRVGASDDLASGKSTFMVEMNEVADILRNATGKSLLILDEIGRGTSTFDGLSIAWAVVEYVADRKKLGAKTLFATHYHELTELEGKIDGVQNYCIAVREKGEDILFLRKIVRGGADKSYGIWAAKLAGVPEEVLNRADEISEQLVRSDITAAFHTDSAKLPENPGKRAGISSACAAEPAAKPAVMEQLSLFDGNAGSGNDKAERRLRREEKEQETVYRKVKEADLMHMTPMDAMNLLYRLQNGTK